MSAHTWDDPEIFQIWTLNQAHQNDCPKENQKKWPIKVIQNHEGETLSESACLSIHMYCTIFLLRNTCSLLSFFVRILFLKSRRARGLSLATGLGLGFDALTVSTLPQSLARNWRPASSHCRPRPPKIKFKCSKFPELPKWWKYNL